MSYSHLKYETKDWNTRKKLKLNFIIENKFHIEKYLSNKFKHSELRKLGKFLDMEYKKYMGYSLQETACRLGGLLNFYERYKHLIP